MLQSCCAKIWNCPHCSFWTSTKLQIFSDNGHLKNIEKMRILHFIKLVQIFERKENSISNFLGHFCLQVFQNCQKASWNSGFWIIATSPLLTPWNLARFSTKYHPTKTPFELSKFHIQLGLRKKIGYGSSKVTDVSYLQIMSLIFPHLSMEFWLSSSLWTYP